VVFRSLQRHGFNAGQLHGDMSQPARNEMLARFKAGEVTLLVCSDVAARGLDIEDMSHVFNFDVPTHSEDYVHRIGRTGRAGREGHSFTIATPEDAYHIAGIESLIGKPIPRLAVEGLATAELAAADEEPGGRRAPGRGHGPGHGGRQRQGHGRGGHGHGPGRGHGQRHEQGRAVPPIGGPATDSPRAYQATPPSGRSGERHDERAEPPQAQTHGRPAASAKAHQPSSPPAPRPDRGASSNARGDSPARPAPQGERRPSEHRPGEHRPVKGLGDHVPAFLRKS
jgi:superfamily II DNA/RNA helicase